MEEVFVCSKPSKVFGIYQIKCLCNSRIYIGSTTRNFTERWAKHRQNFRKGTNTPKLQHAWDKYGESGFEFSILEVVNNKNDVIAREQFWIDSLNPFYNVFRTAGMSFKTTPYLLWVHSPPLCKCGKEVTRYVKKDGSFGSYNATCGDRECGKRPELSDEAKQRIGDSKRGPKHHNYGKSSWNRGLTGIYSEETRRKISENQIDRTKSRLCVCGNPLKRKYTDGKFKGYSSGCCEPICSFAKRSAAKSKMQ